MANRVPKPLDFNKVIKKAVDSDTPFKMVLHAARDVQNSVYSVMNVVALFCKTLVNPDAAAKAIEEATRRTGSAKGSAPSNPWKQQQQKRKQNRMRGRPLGNVKRTSSIQSAQHRGGT
eukprot:342594_1